MHPRRWLPSAGMTSPHAHDASAALELLEPLIRTGLVPGEAGRDLVAAGVPAGVVDGARAMRRRPVASRRRLRLATDGSR